MVELDRGAILGEVNGELRRLPHELGDEAARARVEVLYGDRRRERCPGQA